MPLCILSFLMLFPIIICLLWSYFATGSHGLIINEKWSFVNQQTVETATQFVHPVFPLIRQRILWMQKRCAQSERTEKASLPIVATQLSIRSMGIERRRKHFLPKYFPVSEKKYEVRVACILYHVLHNLSTFLRFLIFFHFHIVNI